MQVNGHVHALAVSSRERTPVHAGQQTGWAPEQVWTVSRKGKSLNPDGVRAPYV